MKKIVIVGGGIAGLSAGIHARQYGFETEIFESHAIAGGQCTGWDRGGYHIDGCIHWLTGTKPGSALYDAWRNVGALGDGVKIVQLDDFGVSEIGGATITLWKDLDRLERDLIAISLEDAAEIKRLMRDVRSLQGMSMPAEKPVDMLSPIELARLLLSMGPSGSAMARLGKITAREYAARYRSPILRAFFASRLPDGYSFSLFAFGLATFTSGNGAIPEGGSRAMALRMERRFRELGGRLTTGMRAVEIALESGRATGVRFEDASFAEADYVIAACDAKVALDGLLKGAYRDRALELRYANPAAYPLASSVQVALGVASEMKGYPLLEGFGCEPFLVGATMCGGIGFKSFAYEPSFAPAAHTALVSSVTQREADYAFWADLRARDIARYRAEKERIGRDVVARFEARYPELAGKISVLDVATPATYNRFTGAYRGAWMSFMLTPKAHPMMHSGKIKGLSNCLLTGQWLEPPGGLPIALTTGKFAAQRIARMEGLRI